MFTNRFAETLTQNPAVATAKLAAIVTQLKTSIPGASVMYADAHGEPISGAGDAWARLARGESITLLAIEESHGDGMPTISEGRKVQAADLLPAWSAN